MASAGDVLVQQQEVTGCRANAVPDSRYNGSCLVSHRSQVALWGEEADRASRQGFRRTRGGGCVWLWCGRQDRVCSHNADEEANESPDFAKRISACQLSI